MAGDEGRVVSRSARGQPQRSQADKESALESLGRTQQAELAGLRAQVLMLQEQMALAAQRRQQVPEGLMAAVAGEAGATGATPATGLHARLLYAETQSLEAELAEGARQ